MKISRLLTPLAALLATFAIAACGETTLDTAKVEDEVQELAEDEDVDVDSVKCPDDVKAKDGDEFECDIETEDGVDIEAEVRQTSDDGDVRVRISAGEIAKAKGGTADRTPVPAPDGGTADASGQDAKLIEQAVRSFVTAARDGDAATFCGQQTDARLARRYGDIQKCAASEEATTPVPSIPDGASVDVEITELSPPNATVKVGSPGSTYEMLDEGGEGGWAIDSIDGE